MNAYRLQQFNESCIVDLVDDASDVRDNAHTYIGGALHEFALTATSSVTDDRRRQYANCIIRELSKAIPNDSENRYLVVDNYVPIADVGKEIARSSTGFWVIVITDSQDFFDSDISNPRYLGWLPKRYLDKLCKALCDVMDGRADHEWVRELVLEAKGQGQSESIRSVKHDIVNLLKPTTIDMESVHQSWVNGGDSAALRELYEVVSMHQGKSNYYQNLLMRARELTFGRVIYPEESEVLSNCSLRPMCGSNITAARNSLLDFACADNLRGTNAWRRLCTLLGIRASKLGYEAVNDSPINRFCQKMDDVAKRGEPLLSAVDPLINYFSTTKWEDGELEGINTFSDWFRSVCTNLAAVTEQILLERAKPRIRKMDESLV